MLFFDPMRANCNLTLKGERVILVPYRPEHVLRYHEWMVRRGLYYLFAEIQLLSAVAHSDS